MRYLKTMDDILDILPEDCDSCPIKKLVGGCSHDARADGCVYQDLADHLASLDTFEV